ncbi:MAG: hypothetical protein JKY56_19700 [Kofleriaceae bacterium]|nr:hypothetical protein [Kofleriaceae bacterium]
MKRNALCLLAALGLVTWNSVAEAQSVSDSKDKEHQEKSETKPDSKFTWAGRVFVRHSLTRKKVGGTIFLRNQQSIDSARFGFKFKHKSGLRAVIKVEASGSKASVRDAYIRLPLSDDIRIIAGRQKRPMSGIALAGKWDLPTIERGLLTDLELPFVGGRQQGVVVEYRLPVAMKPSVSIAAFQAEDVLEIDPSTTLDSSEHFTQDLFLRASLRPVKSLLVSSTLAWIGYQKVRTDGDSYRHSPLASLELEFQNKRVRFWLEGFTGRNISPVLDGPTFGHFWAVRSIIAPRFRPGTPRRLVPYLGISHYDPRISDSDDSNTEGQLGMTLGFSKLWRLQFELSHVFAGGIASSAIEGTAFRIQLGAKFKE